MAPKTSKQYTQSLRDKDQHLIHPFTDFPSFKSTGSEVFSDSNNIYVSDSDGNRYIDGIGGLWCVNIGYGQEEMVEAIAEQVRRLPYYCTFYQMTSPPAAELAAKLAELAPGSLNRVFFGTGGSLANDTAVRIVHFYFNRLGKPAKKLIISRNLGFHGSTYLSAALTGIDRNKNCFDTAENLVHYLSAPDCYRRPEGTTEKEYCDFLVEEFENMIAELGDDRIAAFIAEPIMGAGGVLMAPSGYHERMLALCKKYEILYISDEVVTAFGRLGHFFASEDVFNIVPDMITSAKGISSGYLPLSATILSEEIYEVISVPQAEGALFTHGFTYSGHPVSCAAGLKNIEIIEKQEICEHVRETGPYFEEKLKTLNDLEIVGNVRGKNFMLCVENVKNKLTRETFDDTINIGKRIADHCYRDGLIVRPVGHLNILSPPLVMNRQQIDELVAIIRKAITTTMDDLVREGLWHA